MFSSTDAVYLVFILSLLSTLLLLPVAIRFLKNSDVFQPMRHEDCPALKELHSKKRGTPTMGGLVILAVAILVAAVFGGFERSEGWIVLLSVLSFGMLGAVDDLLKLKNPNARGLRCMPKLLIALLAGGIIGFFISRSASHYSGAVIPWSGRLANIGWFWVPFSALVIAGCSHAVNLTDGMDGLAGGLLAIAFGILGYLAIKDTGRILFMHPRYFMIAIWCAALAGACAGFLWFNSCPASVFMGDIGSLGLGAALGTLSLMINAGLILVILGGVFVAEAISVMLQVASYKFRNKKRIFRVAPLHHHFQVGGVSENKLVVRFWLAGIVLGFLAISAF